MKIKLVLSIVLSLSLGLRVVAQDLEKYWVELDPTRFLLSEAFKIDSLVIESKSIWLNAFSVKLSLIQKQNIEKNDLVLAVSKVKVLHNERCDAKTVKYGDYISVLKPEYFDALGIDGRGVVVGVIDAGFVDVDSGAAFQHLVKNNRILGYKDFILDSTRKDFFDKQTRGDFHGANVLAYMGGYNPETNERIGLATGASYYLARTENGDKEHLVEEDDWIEAIEWMYSKGVRVVNTSLGYSEFDDSTENHSVKDMNGKTTRISIAAQKAVDKGMILVCSAGNLGLKPWKYVSAPADTEGVISVGATKKDDFSKEGYSSVGPEFNKYIKPDISTYSNAGTSYSSPEIAGLVTCMLQKYPSLSSTQVKEALAIAGNMNPLPNNFVGYGVPDPVILFDYLAGKEITAKKVKMIVESDSMVRIRTYEKLDHGIVVFHKIDKVHVLEQLRISDKKLNLKGVKKIVTPDEETAKYKSKIKRKGLVLKLYRPQGVNFSTVVINGDLIEIEWRD